MEKMMARTKALSMLDLAMFVLESAERMANVGPLAILKPPAGYKSSSHFADWLMERMQKKPVGEPFDYMYRPPGLRRLPRLEAIDAVDVPSHCQRLALPAPGTDKQLFELICRLHVNRLDRSRPPWEFYIIDGLERGRIAIYAKVHHGIIDGKTFVDVCTNWFSSDPKSREIRALWQGVPRPRSSNKAVDEQRSLIRSATNFARQIVGGSFTVAYFYRILVKQALKTMGLGKGTPLPFLNTPSVFRAPPAVRRSFAYCIVPLQAMKEFGTARGATVNDILLTILDMALNRYLNEKSRHKRKPLVADMPLALGSGGGGNQIAILQFPLGGAKANPAERLREICQQTREVKHQVMGESAGAMILYTAAIHAVPALTELLGIGALPMLANMVISNPFGLPGRRYLGGADVEMILPLSVLAPGQSLNITAATYDKGLQIAFLGIAREIPDIQKLADYTVEAFEELRAAFGELTTVEVGVKKTAAKKHPAIEKPPARTPPKAATPRPARAAITPAATGRHPAARLAASQRTAAERPASTRVARKSVAV
jgi:diacylglycerol O-acyltransferase / wax synthase